MLKYPAAVENNNNSDITVRSLLYMFDIMYPRCAADHIDPQAMATHLYSAVLGIGKI